MSKDAVKGPSEKKAAKPEASAEPAKPTEAELARQREEELFADLKANAALIEKAVQQFESRYTTRALRSTAAVRRRLTATLLAQAIAKLLGPEAPVRPTLLAALAAAGAKPATTTSDEKPGTTVVEVEIYFGLLVLLILHDAQDYARAMTLAEQLVARVHAENRRTLDELAAKVYFYYSRFYELEGRTAEIRPRLLALQRAAVLRNDAESQAVLLNLLLRNYLQYNLYEQADKLVSKTTLPEASSNNQTARYLYYLGRIKAIQLDYTSAHRHLFQALRKAPAAPKYAAGFQQAVQKLLVIVQLLMGTIPEHSLFSQPVFRKTLAPYLSLVQAVRVGDLPKFQQTLASHGAQFRKDKTYTLILRLRHNVIKTGIRMISLSYSRISLRDICLKLQLDSEEDAEYIVAKTIRDGVVDAKINHERGFMQSTETLDVYATTEPQTAFSSRIAFCLNLHDECVKGMRYPIVNTAQKEAENAEEMREEERLMVKEILEGGDDEDDAMGGDF